MKNSQAGNYYHPRARRFRHVRQADAVGFFQAARQDGGLIEVVGEGSEVFGVDCAIVIEIPFIPYGAAQAEIV
jgi:hypothetical protein